VPSTQVEVRTRLGTFWGDLGWPEWRLLLEYDGRPKYAERGGEALVAEKRRHDALVEAGWRALRITKEDLEPSGELLARVVPLLPQAVTRALRPRRELSW
jgi:very-short-patch-repair endonuclease